MVPINKHKEVADIMITSRVYGLSNGAVDIQFQWIGALALSNGFEFRTLCKLIFFRQLGLDKNISIKDLKCE